jgi:hypothetical protein
MFSLLIDLDPSNLYPAQEKIGVKLLPDLGKMIKAKYGPVAAKEELV